ncbi:MAG: DUF255 domain-containing protein [Gammaproteobacteria bacterium]|nr:DUF255 domain-containing protein [Gammaproteobacteria bacterium]
MFNSYVTRGLFMKLLPFSVLLCALPSAAGSLPGAEPYTPELQTSLQAKLAGMGKSYLPRTEHLQKDGQPKFTNRLILENSPYLRQHAHNPVNWFAWGPEAFAKARRENKPVFLSIGYSTCHWCHVMERESFENIAIARILNEHFVSIKVDRERRPEVDTIYMAAVMFINRTGGWPMSVFLTPEGKPIYGATYFKPEVFSGLLEEIAAAWKTQNTEVREQADRITAAVERITSAGGKAQAVGKKAIQQAVTDILARHDNYQGGFGESPKFPQETWLFLLLEHVYRTGDPQVLAAVETTLFAMAEGGIYDQVGGGFHRYSTDPQWLVPHFEKMLYNQAHLGRIYAQAYRITGQAFYARIARQTLDYVLRDMTSVQEGGFYSATDADSAAVPGGETEEGLFFLWTREQLREALSGPQAELAIDLYGVSEHGNFEDASILYLPLPLAEYAQKSKISLPELLEKTDAIHKALYALRKKREHPLRDEKIITAWNGMMITALAQASELLDEPRYLEAALRAAEFLWKNQRPASKQIISQARDSLLRVYLHGHVSVPAILEDYAYLAEALLTLYDVTGAKLWLDRGRLTADAMVRRFRDKAQGGFFIHDAEDELLITRPKSPSDDAIPSGNAVAVRVLAMLAVRTGEERYANEANAAIAAFSANIAEHPPEYAYLLLAADELLHGEVGPRRYGARGTVKAVAKLEKHENERWLDVTLEIRDGWHVNARRPLQKDLVPTLLSLDENQKQQLGPVVYPQAKIRRLSFQQSPLALYEGKFHLRAPLLGEKQENSTGKLAVQLKFQACSDEVCLAPETLLLTIN